MVTLVEESGRTWTYAIEIVIYPRAKFTAENKVIYLPSADPSTETKQSVTLELYASREKELPTDIRFACEGVELLRDDLFETVEQVSEGIWVRRVPVNLSVRTPASSGPYHKRLTARYLSEGVRHEVQVGISGTVRSLFEITPQYVFFGQVSDPKYRINREVTIRRTDGKPLSMSVAEVSSDAIRASVKKSADPHECVLVLELSADQFRDAIYGSVVLNVNHAQQPIVKVQFAASVRTKK